MIEEELNIEEMLKGDNPKELRAIFSFDNEPDELVIFKFNLWARKFFPKYFSSEDADFHEKIDGYNLSSYRGKITSFTNIAFRGAAKTVRTKLFLAYCICNDQLKSRKYIKVLSEDGVNSKQIVTDIYNMLISIEVRHVYPEIFRKTSAKREETMSSFTTSTGIKITAGTVGTDQRGALQEEARPDLIWFEDFENRKTLRSAVKTKAIWDNMEEARTGLAKGGSCIYTCNYISERGNVHTLVTKGSERNIVLIVPIIKDGVIAWDRYSLLDIAQMRKDDDDFEGERLCEPSASKDIIFDRKVIDSQIELEPIKEINGFRMYRAFDPSHRYGSGHDISGGVGLDSSTSVFIDFSTIPAQVVATYDTNTMKPDIFGDEIKREAEYYGECYVGPEKNLYGHATIGRLKQIYDKKKIHKTKAKETRILTDTEETEYGWHTNTLTKPKMIFDFSKAVHDGLLVLNCPKLKREARSYTRNDLMDAEEDVRLTTRHFDLLIAGAIAWQMKDYVDISATAQKEMDEIQKIMDTVDFDPYEV